MTAIEVAINNSLHHLIRGFIYAKMSIVFSNISQSIQISLLQGNPNCLIQHLRIGEFPYHMTYQSRKGYLSGEGKFVINESQLC